MLNKLTLYLCAIVPLTGALSACSSDNVSADIPEQGFGVTFTAREASRATLTSDLNITDNTFVVYGDMVQTSTPTATPTTVFDATPVTYADGKWSYANLQYWFPSHTYSFVALHPAADNNVSDINYQNSQLSFTYTYPDDYTQATDLLVANHRRRYSDNRTDNGSGTITGTINPVEFNFRHLMARINFTGNVNAALTSNVTFHSITISGLYGKSTYTVTPASVSQTATLTDDYTEDWTSVTTEEPTTIVKKTFSGQSSEVAPGNNIKMFPDDDPLLLLPQELPQNVTVTIDYSIDGNHKTASTNLYGTAMLAHSGEWLPRKTYNYNFSVGVNEYIIFSQPTVNEWKESAGGNYVIAD